MKNKIILLSDRAAEYFLYLLIFFLPFAKAGVEICFSFAFLAWILKRILLKNFKLAHTDLNIPFLAFIAVSSVSLLNTNYIGKSLEGLFFRWMEYAILYFIIVETINNRKRLKNVLTIILISGVIIGIDGIIQYFTWTDLLRQQHRIGSWITASFGHNNTFAQYLEAILPIYICLLLFGFKNKKIKVIISLAIVLLVVCLALTFSRGGWFAFLVALIFIGILKDKRVLVTLIIFLCISPFILPNSIKERAVNTFKNWGDLADSDRLVLGRVAIRMIQDRPFFGHGLNTYMYNYGKYRIEGEKEGAQLSHNCYLMIAAETGLVGFAMFMWILFALFKKSLSSLRSLKEKAQEGLGKIDEALLLGILAGIVATLTHSFFDNNLQTLQPATLFWFMVGLIIALQRIAESSSLSSK